MLESADVWAWFVLHVHICCLMVDVQERLKVQCLQCMELYSTVLSITGKLYISVDVGCIQQRIWIDFRHKSRDDQHPFAHSTRSAQDAGWLTSLLTLNFLGTSHWIIHIPLHAQRAFHKSLDDPHPFARSTRLAQAATIHHQCSVHNGIVGLINCFVTTISHI